MARYIDADKFIERLKASPAFPNMGMDGYFLLNVIENLLKKFPTADVTPRAEAEKWFRECEELQGRMIELEREIAREIFEKFIIISESPYRIHIIVEKEEFDELKKKYGVTDKNVGCNKEEQK